MLHHLQLEAVLGGHTDEAAATDTEPDTKS
jgi:hypothetical protein